MASIITYFINEMDNNETKVLMLVNGLGTKTMWFSWKMFEMM